MASGAWNNEEYNLKVAPGTQYYLNCKDKNFRLVKFDGIMTTVQSTDGYILTLPAKDLFSTTTGVNLKEEKPELLDDPYELMIPCIISAMTGAFFCFCILKTFGGC